MANLHHGERPPWETTDDELSAGGPEIISEGLNIVVDDQSYVRDDDSSVQVPLTQSSGQPNKVHNRQGYESTTAQKVCLITAHVLAVAALVTVSIWINNKGMGMGGLSWKEGEAGLVFNWHPLMMIIAFVLMTFASLAFKSPCCFCLDRFKKKVYHGVMWTLAAGCMVVGVIAVFKSHNDGVSGYKPNLYSLHSWVGIGVLSLYSLQFLGGVTFFGLQLGQPQLRANVLQLHLFFGQFIYYSMAVTILLGIQEKEGFIGCGYSVDAPDLRPYENFYRIPEACQIGHSLGLIVFLLALTTGYGLYKFEKKEE